MTSMLPDLPFIEIRPLQSLIDPRVQPWRIGASLFVVFGLLAMLIATVGLYAVIAYEVTQRTHEFGVRAALGATGPAIVAHVLRRGVALAFSGVDVGLAMARLGAPWVTLLLFDTSPTSLGVFTTVGSVVLAVALVACLVPARRAALSDPAAALRVD
jgi:ABC-type antimicrobial peptide transport system permease subunit